MIQDWIKKITVHNTNTILKWLILLALVLLMVSLGLLLFGGTSFSEKDVVVLLEGPAQAASGDELVYTLKYRNNTNVDLKDLRFRFFYPEGAIVPREDSFVEEVSEGFEVDLLKPDQEGEKEFHAFIVGEKGSIKTANVQLIFQAGNLRSEFQKSSSVSTAITDLPIPITFVAPPNAISGQEVSYILDYRNASDGDIADLRIIFEYPDGFTPSKLTPKATSGSTTWDIPLLKQATGSRITITGILVGTERETKPVAVTLQRKIRDQYVDYERASSSTVIGSPLLSTTLSVHNSRDYTASAGDRLIYGVRYRNTGTQNLSGVTLAVKLEGEMYDLSTLETNGGFFDGSTNTISWTSGDISDFRNLAPAREGRVEFRVTLKSSFPTTNGSKNFFVKALAKVSTPNVPDGVDGDEVSAYDNLVTKISTQPIVNQSMYFQDPVHGSSGVYPPQVDTKTTFTIHWELVNPGNDMRGVTVKAQLPSGVLWKGVTTSSNGLPKPTYNKSSSEVLWDLGRIPQGIGVLSAKYEGAFQVSVTPSLVQRGSTLEITKPVTFSGVDTFTGQNIVVTNPGLRSGDVVDQSGDGVVR